MCCSSTFQIFTKPLTIGLKKLLKTRMAAFQGMQVLTAKHSDMCLPRKCDYRTDKRTEPRQSDH